MKNGWEGGWKRLVTCDKHIFHLPAWQIEEKRQLCVARAKGSVKRLPCSCRDGKAKKDSREKCISLDAWCSTASSLVGSDGHPIAFGRLMASNRNEDRRMRNPPMSFVDLSLSSRVFVCVYAYVCVRRQSGSWRIDGRCLMECCSRSDCQSWGRGEKDECFGNSRLLAFEKVCVVSLHIISLVERRLYIA